MKYAFFCQHCALMRHLPHPHSLTGKYVTSLTEFPSSQTPTMQPVMSIYYNN